jgi:hypothetical protein
MSHSIQYDPDFEGEGQVMNILTEVGCLLLAGHLPRAASSSLITAFGNVGDLVLVRAGQETRGLLVQLLGDDSAVSLAELLVGCSAGLLPSVESSDSAASVESEPVALFAGESCSRWNIGAARLSLTKTVTSAPMAVPARNGIRGNGIFSVLVLFNRSEARAFNRIPSMAPLLPASTGE